MKQFYLLSVLSCFTWLSSCRETTQTYTEVMQNVVEVKTNSIQNNTNNPYFGDVANFCLDEMGLTGIDLTIVPIDDESKRENRKNGISVDAHLRYYGDYYILYINEDIKWSIEEVISHELVHLSQYNSGRLSYENGLITWLGKSYGVEELDYNKRPWEKEAFDSEEIFARKILTNLK